MRHYVYKLICWKFVEVNLKAGVVDGSNKCRLSLRRPMLVSVWIQTETKPLLESLSLKLHMKCGRRSGLKRASERIYGHASYFLTYVHLANLISIVCFWEITKLVRVGTSKSNVRKVSGKGGSSIVQQSEKHFVWSILTPKQCPHLQTASAGRLLQFHPIGKSEERVMHLWQPGINCVTSVFTGQRRFTRSFSDIIKW